MDFSRCADPWSIAIARGTSPFALRAERPAFTRDDAGDFADFVADPFLLQRDGVWHLFFELLDRPSGLGEIGLTTSRDLVAWRYEGIVLRESFHLSYPHVFAHDGAIYMTPETLGARAVRLYRADPFPARWTHIADLVPRVLADPTPFVFDGRWWLFGCPRPHQHDALSLFTADSLIGEWREHLASPLIDGDRRTARPAGRVVVMNGRPIRFAQECVPRYGSAVRAFEITTLTRDAYADQPCAAEPILRASGSGWNGAGMHHVDAQQLPDGSWIAAVDGHHS